VQVVVSVQYQVTAIYDAFYKLTDSRSQITSYVFDVVRATVPKIYLDDVFTTKDEIALGEPLPSICTTASLAACTTRSMDMQGQGTIMTLRCVLHTFIGADVVQWLSTMLFKGT